MKRTILIISIFISCLGFTGIKNWEPASEAKVNFSIDGMFGIDVNGTISDLKADIHFFPNDPVHSIISATISPATINTKNKKRDAHLKTVDFLDVEKYPSISFVSKNIRKVGEYYVADGELTLKKVSKLIAIPFEFTDTGSNGVFTGDFNINRLDYNVGMKSIWMGNEVRVHLNIPVTKK
jgi:polyisoprenoid-binding protein YceI